MDSYAFNVHPDVKFHPNCLKWTFQNGYVSYASTRFLRQKIIKISIRSFSVVSLISFCSYNY